MKISQTNQKTVSYYVSILLFTISLLCTMFVFGLYSPNATAQEADYFCIEPVGCTSFGCSARNGIQTCNSSGGSCNAPCKKFGDQPEGGGQN